MSTYIVQLKKWVNGYISFIACAKLLQLCLTLCNLWIVACQAPLSMGFSRQEYWSGLPWPPAGDLPNSGIESSPASPALQADSLLLSHWGSPYKIEGDHNLYRNLEKDDITSVRVGRRPCGGTRESISEELGMWPLDRVSAGRNVCKRHFGEVRPA